MTGTCKSCIFMEVCDANMNKCDNYYSEDDNEYMNDVIENGRKEYYDEWFSYVKEYDDDIFF